MISTPDRQTAIALINEAITAGRAEPRPAPRWKSVTAPCGAGKGGQVKA